MANPKNTADLAELKEKLAGANSVVLTEYRGLTVSQLQELRNDLGFDVEYSLSLIHISEPTRRLRGSRMPSSA